MSSENRAKLEEKYQSFISSFPKVTAIDAKTLHTQLENSADKPTLVDVRTPEEQQVSMIPGAIRRDIFEAHKEEYRTTPLVAYCTVGFRSGKYAQQLMEEGFNVKNFKGSIIAWTQEGFPLVKDTSSNEPTKRVHIFGEQWKLQGEGYDPVWFAKPKSYFEMFRTLIPQRFARSRKSIKPSSHRSIWTALAFILSSEKHFSLGHFQAVEYVEK
ncbi:hypothetical protein WJX84_005824 [Apatococcus fuscideae]|uniref:Rhodanese domain-containing protein n=1 Tax=Apatococcus fuscideae TaxID=2026836 RepID=A0AAW1T9X5_9CHLO